MRVSDGMRPFVLVLAGLVAAAPIIAESSFAQAAGSKRAQAPAEQALMRQPRDQCELSKPPESLGGNDARVAMLDYERQCYRQLAEIERAKLIALQAARTPNKAAHSNNRRVYKRPIRYRGRPDGQMAGR